MGETVTLFVDVGQAFKEMAVKPIIACQLSQSVNLDILPKIGIATT